MKSIQRWIQSILAVPWIHFIYNLFQRFGNDNGAFYAAGLSFFSLLSFAPIILTGVAILGCFINVHIASERVTEALQNLLPEGGARNEALKFLTQQLKIEDQVKQVVNHRGVAGVIGFLSLIWATLQIFINAAVAMNAMWEVPETRNWFVLRGRALLLMVITGTLTAFSLFLSSVPTAIEAWQLPVINRLPMPLGLLSAAFEVIALLVNAAMYLMIYKLLPNARVSWIAAAIGGLTASFLFEVAKKGLASYLLRANHSLYGELANLILFVLWIYYSMTILLLGAELTAAVARERGEADRPKQLHSRPTHRTARGTRIHMNR